MGVDRRREAFDALCDAATEWMESIDGDVLQDPLGQEKAEEELATAALDYAAAILMTTGHT